MTRVAGYRAWQSLSRQVRKGEQGIAILAPCVYRKRPVDDTEGGDPPELGRILRGFRVAYVWDESQTDGPPLADVRPQLLVGDDPAQLWAGLVAQLDAEGYTVSRGDCGGANGSTDFVTRTVTVRDDVDDLQAVKTLTHERAHALLHDPSQGPIARDRAEVEAESVAYIVCQRAGLATAEYSLPYVARWFSLPGRGLSLMSTLSLRRDPRLSVDIPRCRVHSTYGARHALPSPSSGPALDGG